MGSEEGGNVERPAQLLARPPHSNKWHAGLSSFVGASGWTATGTLQTTLRSTNGPDHWHQHRRVDTRRREGRRTLLPRRLERGRICGGPSAGLSGRSGVLLLALLCCGCRHCCRQRRDVSMNVDGGANLSSSSSSSLFWRDFVALFPPCFHVGRYPIRKCLSSFHQITRDQSDIVH